MATVPERPSPPPTSPPEKPVSSPACGSPKRSSPIVCTDEFEVERHVEDGDRVAAGQKLLPVTTRTRDLLTAERSALNLLVPAVRHRDRHPRLGRRPGRHRGRRSATPARRLRGCARWRSTRYAAAAASTTACRSRTRHWSRTTTSSPRAASAEAFTAVREAFPEVPIEVEVDTLHQLREVVEAGADLILLDNFTPGETARGGGPGRRPRRPGVVAAASPWTTRAPTPTPASTTSPSAP